MLVKILEKNQNHEYKEQSSISQPLESTKGWQFLSSGTIGSLFALLLNLVVSSMKIITFMKNYKQDEYYEFFF